MSNLNSTRYLILAIMSRLPAWDWTRGGIEEEIQSCSKSALPFTRWAVQKLLEDGRIRLGEEIRIGKRKFKTFRRAN